jgi:iron complex outermembrane recepter protein
MRTWGGVCLAPLAMLLIAAPASAQDQPAGQAPTQTAPQGQTQAPPAPSKASSKAKAASDSEEPDAEVSEVTVTGRKLPQPGAVVGDIKPELQLSPADIQSYGVSTVTELLNELSPETESDRGRSSEPPVVLLNGRRISSMNEIQNIPTEAILRVDILPEEVSLKYGYTADQRVVNIVLRRRFRAITGEVVGGATTEGSEATGQGEVDLLHIRGNDRLNLDLKYTGSSELTDADRGVIPSSPNQPFALGGNVVAVTPGGQIDPALTALAGRSVTIAGVPAAAASRMLALQDFVATAGQANTTNTANDYTLSPAQQTLTGNAVLSHELPMGISGTFNATLGASTSDALQGLPGASLTVPDGNPFSPFTQAVQVDRYFNDPLAQSTTGWTAHLGSTLNRDVGKWRLSLTDAYDYSNSQTNTDTGVDTALLQAKLNALSSSLNPFGAISGSQLVMLENRANAQSHAVNMQILANGPIVDLPAGQLYASLKAGDTGTWFLTHSDTMAGIENLDLSRNDFNVQGSFDVPLTSRDDHVLGFIGDLSVNGNVAVDVLSDFGTLTTLGYGVNWTPVEGVNFIVSTTHDHAAPTVQQLGNPVIVTPGVAALDYSTGQDVNITTVTGGNADLLADTRNVWKVGLTLKPPQVQNLTITANYIDSRIRNPVETFPAATAAIEAAFPTRFERDVDGDLIEEDETPVNFSSWNRQSIRWGFNYSRPVGPQPQPRFRRPRPRPQPGDNANGQGGDNTGAPGQDNGEGRSNANGGNGPGGQGSGGQNGAQNGGGDNGGDGGGRRGGGYGGGGGGGRGGGFRGGGGGFGGGGRFQIAFYHTIYFNDQMLIRPGVPALDLLNGAPVSNTGGQPRQKIQAQMGLTMFGLGARLSANWQSSTQVSAGAASSTGDLSFSGLTTINLRLFANLGQMRQVVVKHPFLRGTRITLSAVNLFDDRIQVKDAMGLTPLAYQSPYLDPAGRTVTLSLRKLFF